MILKVCLFSVCVILCGCGPGMADFESPIGNGYYFSFVGRDATSISYKNPDEKLGGIVISSSVQQFFLWKKKIFVSRKARICTTDDDITSCKVSKACEYWIVDVTTHEVMGPFDELERDKLKVWVDLNNSSEKINLAERILPCSLVF